MQVTVVGAGRVGLASAVSLHLAGHRVVLVEKDAERVRLLRAHRIPFLEPGLQRAWQETAVAIPVVEAVEGAPPGELLLCCVGTPPGIDGRADLRQVEALWQGLGDGTAPVVAMRSTLPPGTGRALARRLEARGMGYVAYPEFLREGTALEDELRPGRVVVGADDPALHGLMERLHGHLSCPRLEVDVPTAELIKMASNAHLAMRVTFANELAWLARAVGADFAAVRQGLGLDPRIGPHYLEPGPGFGGPCLPKDLAALIRAAEDWQCDVPLLEATQRSNALQPLRVVERLRQDLGDLHGRWIAVWGLAFKPETEEVLGSPAVVLVDQLMAAGARVAVHDPAARAALPGVAVVPAPEAAAAGCAALVVATAWGVYREVSPAAVVPTMAAPRVVWDLRAVLDGAAWRAVGAVYRALGRPEAGDGA